MKRFINKNVRQMTRALAVLAECALLLASHAGAQEVKATAQVDSSKILIGDWLRVNILVEHPAGLSVHWPTLTDSIEGLEIVALDSLKREDAGGRVRESTVMTVTAFDSGTYMLPPLPFRYTLPGDTTTHVAETSPVPIFVRTLDVDTSKEIRDIKPPLGVPVTFAELLPYLIGIALLALALWLFFYIKKKRGRGERIIPQAPRRPAHEIALDALRSLEAEHLWQRGKVKEYHSQLTDILRMYLEQRFEILAMEMTTDDILASSVIRSLAGEVRERLQTILARADVVKFAKFQPAPPENEASLSSAVAIIESTWRRQQEIPAPQAQPQPATIEAGGTAA